MTSPSQTLYPSTLEPLQQISLYDGARDKGHDWLLAALNSMAAGFIIYDSDGILVATNKRYRELCPQLADTMTLGRHHDDIVRAAVAEGAVILHEMSGEEYIRSRTRERMAPGDPVVVQFNDERWIRIEGRRLDDGSTIFAYSDVTEWKQQELASADISAELAVKSNLLDAALMNMVQGLVLYDRDNNFVLCNKNYQEMLKYTDEDLIPGTPRLEMIKKSLAYGIYEKEFAKRLVEECEAIGAKIDPFKDDKVPFSDGRTYSVHGNRMSDGSKVITFQDITEQERIKDQLNSNNSMLERANDELQSFAQVASHDLQEPLRKIEAFGTRLAAKHQHLLPQEGQMFVERMNNAAGRMRLLIEGLLSFSRVKSDETMFAPVDLNEVLRGVLSDMQIRLEECGGRVECATLPTISANAIQMRQLFQNLLSNGLKFSRAGVNPVITISGHEELTTSAVGDVIPMLRLEFADNGIGFDSKHKDEIFAVFKRLHGRAEYEGSGIGLSTCRKIVEHHNGTIDAHGVIDQGATFVVELPIGNVEG